MYLWNTIFDPQFARLGEVNGDIASFHFHGDLFKVSILVRPDLSTISTLEVTIGATLSYFRFFCCSR